MSAHIEIGSGKQIGEGVIVSSHNKRLVDEILFEVVHNSPLECEGTRLYPSDNSSQP